MRHLPPPMHGLLREARRQYVSCAVGSDRGSRSALRTLLRGRGNRTVDVRVRQLGGQAVTLRGGTTDAEVAVATFAGKYHRPPSPLHPMRMVWDIGANIGLTTIDFAASNPRTRVIALEPHPDNCRIAALNLRPVTDRCQLLECAAWIRDGDVALEGELGPEDGYRVGESNGERTVPALSLNTLLDRYGAPDYVKLDVEGAEARLLREATEWAASVRCLSVECHPPYTVDDCQRDLVGLGFTVTLFRESLRRRARDCAVGLRRSAT